jgi:hypothetical protein
MLKTCSILEKLIPLGLAVTVFSTPSLADANLLSPGNPMIFDGESEAFVKPGIGLGVPQPSLGLGILAIGTLGSVKLLVRRKQQPKLAAQFKIQNSELPSETDLLPNFETKIPVLNQLEINWNSPWYEKPDGTCNIQQPTLINMGDDKPLHLMFPVHWSKSLNVLDDAKKLASQLDAFLVLVLYGEASESEMASLTLEFATARVLPIWLGQKNRQQFDKVTAVLSR